ncbi:uncharacterized protein B0H18DRAFT_997000 [Fomitopsis serialis]|uniref:uncharacterized protein n=1 Tax=Fomitopsis serialis TaxID=139415 RepID=UPI00200783BC|nr:uncharacterized protein B0H18DRAFT_997000 [Neoantrodia serialis]KAH9929401.1 hypothetical protein B0H18DRAFT_997000 [Neoantrodia serialis]
MRPPRKQGSRMAFGTTFADSSAPASEPQTPASPRSMCRAVRSYAPEVPIKPAVLTCVIFART